MARKKALPKSEEEIIIENSIIESPVHLDKIESCKVLYIKDKIFAIDFKGYGISFSTENSFLDTDLIPQDFIDISYTGEIGSPDFKYKPIYINS